MLFVVGRGSRGLYCSPDSVTRMEDEFYDRVGHVRSFEKGALDSRPHIRCICNSTLSYRITKRILGTIYHIKSLDR